jgi:hypothetical protein
MYHSNKRAIYIQARCSWERTGCCCYVRKTKVCEPPIEVRRHIRSRITTFGVLDTQPKEALVGPAVLAKQVIRFVQLPKVAGPASSLRNGHCQFPRSSTLTSHKVVPHTAVQNCFTIMSEQYLSKGIVRYTYRRFRLYRLDVSA